MQKFWEAPELHERWKRIKYLHNDAGKNIRSTKYTGENRGKDQQESAHGEE